MTGPFRSLAAALAILATLLTAGAVGAARGQAMAAGEIVLCTGAGVVTLAVDAQGNPTGPAHWCPDCVLTHLAGVPGDLPLIAVPGAVSAAARAPEPFPLHAARAAAPQARGPPRA